MISVEKRRYELAANPAAGLGKQHDSSKTEWRKESFSGRSRNKDCTASSLVLDCWASADLGAFTEALRKRSGSAECIC
jgi:hypothetical protein